jgi:hypothetical protein
MILSITCPATTWSRLSGSDCKSTEGEFAKIGNDGEVVKLYLQSAAIPRGILTNQRTVVQDHPSTDPHGMRMGELLHHPN